MSATIDVQQNDAAGLRAGPTDFIARLVTKRYKVTSNVHAKSGTVIYKMRPGHSLQATYEMRAPDGKTYTGVVTATSASTGTYVDSTGNLTGSLEMVDVLGDTVNWRSDDDKEFGKLLR